jgi:hypothetical protein
MAKDLRFVGGFSTVPAMFDNADFLLALGEANSEKQHQTILAASAAVVLAVCLDQGTLFVLDIADQTAHAAGAQSEVAALRALLGDKFRRRVMRLPEVLTNSTFQLAPRSPEVRAIHDLITLRNELMHVTEEADVLDFESNAPITLPAAKVTNRWLMVGLEEVKRYRAAVKLYVDEVLFPPANTICKGKIVIRR